MYRALTGRAGAVFAIEASRLARNGRDWHTLIEFCGLVGTIIIDDSRARFGPYSERIGSRFFDVRMKARPNPAR